MHTVYRATRECKEMIEVRYMKAQNDGKKIMNEEAKRTILLNVIGRDRTPLEQCKHKSKCQRKLRKGYGKCSERFEFLAKKIRDGKVAT